MRPLLKACGIDTTFTETAADGDDALSLVVRAGGSDGTGGRPWLVRLLLNAPNPGNLERAKRLAQDIVARLREAGPDAARLLMPRAISTSAG